MDIASAVRSVFLFVLIAAPVMSVHGADVSARSLASNCTGCHGPNGNSSGAIPSIAGLEQAYFIEVLQSFRAGQRESTIMHQHAKGYTDAEIQRMAQFFASQRRRP